MAVKPFQIRLRQLHFDAERDLRFARDAIDNRVALVVALNVLAGDFLQQGLRRVGDRARNGGVRNGIELFTGNGER